MVISFGSLREASLRLTQRIFPEDLPAGTFRRPAQRIFPDDLPVSTSRKPTAPCRKLCMGLLQLSQPDHPEQIVRALTQAISWHTVTTPAEHNVRKKTSLLLLFRRLQLFLQVFQRILALFHAGLPLDVDLFEIIQNGIHPVFDRIPAGVPFHSIPVQRG